MSKGGYNVNETNVGPTKDGSFRSCLCAMLVFVSICVILLIVAWPWKSANDNGKSVPRDNFGNAYEQRGNAFSTTKRPSKPNDIDYNSSNETELEEDEKTTIIPFVIVQSRFGKLPNNMSTIHPEETSTISTVSTMKPNKVNEKKYERLSVITFVNKTETTTIINSLEDNETVQKQNNYTEEITTELLEENKTKTHGNKLQKLIIHIFGNQTDDSTTTENDITTFNLNKNIFETLPTETETFTSATTTNVITLSTVDNFDEKTKNPFESVTTTETSETTTNLITETTILSNKNELLSSYNSSQTINNDTSDNESTTPTEKVTTEISKIIFTSTAFNKNDQPTTTENTNETPTNENVTPPPTTTTINTESTKESSYVEIMETDEVVSHVKPKTTVPPKDNQQEKNLKENKLEKDKCGAKCKEVGARILSRMNHSADPCEQFYEYACGGDNNDNTDEDNWNRIADGLDRVHVRSPDVFKTFKAFYDSCVAFHSDFDYEKRVNEAKILLQSVGKPYKSDSTEDPAGTQTGAGTETSNGGNETAALTDLLTKMLQLDSSPLFDISVDVNKQSQQFVFQLNLPKRFSSLQDENSVFNSQMKCIRRSKKHFDASISLFEYIDLNEMYKVYSNCQQNNTEYIETVEKALDVFGIYADLDEDNVIEHVELILNEFRQLPSPATLRKDFITKNFVFKKVSELMNQYPFIDWLQLLRNLAKKEVDKENLVQVYNEKFFMSIFSRKAIMTKSELYNTLLAMFAHDLYTNLVLPMTMIDQEKFCLHQSSYLMKEIASSIYLNSLNDKNMETNLISVNQLFTEMKDELSKMFSVAEWATDSRVSLNKKLGNIKVDTWKKNLVWKNISKVQERMKSVNKSFDSYPQFAFALIKRNQEMLYSMWNTTAHNEENIWWHFTTPFNTNPVSIYALNKIVVPPAMLITMSKELPSYLSLAKVGYHLAKAIGNHFDFTGVNYKLHLPGRAKFAYNELQTFMAISYSDGFKRDFDRKSISFKVINETLSLTLNQRFVEDMAINLISIMSAKAITDYPITWISNPKVAETYSREKIFFVALGQEHCRKPRLEEFFLQLFESEHLPSSVLLDVALSNSQLFSDTFVCKIGALVNNQFKYKVFPDMSDEGYEEEN